MLHGGWQEGRMQSVIRAYPTLPGPEKGKGDRKKVDSLTSVEHTVAVIAGVHMGKGGGGVGGNVGNRGVKTRRASRRSSTL